MPPLSSSPLSAGSPSKGLNGPLFGLVGRGLSMVLNPAETNGTMKLRLMGWGFSALAGILLLVGAWRMLELALGPILAPLTAAGALALVAVAVFVTAHIQQRRQAARKPRLPTGLLITLAEIWLTPKSLRRSMATGLAVSWLHRQILGRR